MIRSTKAEIIACTGPKTLWRCYHGISSTVPCPDCYIIWQRDAEVDKSREWEGGIS